jgi:DnaK suppressor protein
MNRTEQESFRPLLRQAIEEAGQALHATAAEDTAPVSPDVAIGRLSRLDSMQMQQMALAMQQRQKEAIRELQEALRRIDQGVFGRCQLCGQDIPAERLRYLPAATCCVTCLEKHSRR